MRPRSSLMLAAAALSLVALQGASAQPAPPPNAPAAAETRRDGPRMSPQEFHARFCNDRYARTYGHLGYMSARLGLTPQQRPYWDAYQQAAVANAEKQKTSCLEQAASAQDRPPTLVERMQREQRMLSMRQEELQATLPAVQALYQSLTPEQQTMLDRPHRGRGGHGWHGGPRHAAAEPAWNRHVEPKPRG